MKFYIYIYRDPSRKNEAIYVGKGQGRRAYEHLDGGSHSNHLNNRLAKMKRNRIEPIINVVDMPSEALAVQCEIDTIARFGRKDLKLGPLLNQTDGGEGASGYRHTEEGLQKISDANKGENHPLFGRPRTAITKQKLAVANIGKSHTEASKQKMSDANKGENHPMYGKTGEKHHNYGKLASASTKQRMSEAHKGVRQPQIICPHCGKGGGNSMKRWHFDNCKLR